MARIPRVVPLQDGQVSVRAVIPSAIVKVCEQVSQDLGIPFEAALRMLLREISHRFDEGEAMFLSSSFQAALRAVRERHFGVINESAPLMDLSKVHRSSRTKSGFVGVYANGKGFRAMGRTSLTNPALRSLGTYPTAEEAAWRRYCYYKQNGLPYGELEVEMERWRSGEAGGGPFKGSDKDLIRAIREHARIVGTEEEIFGPNGENAPRTLLDEEQPTATADNNVDDVVPLGFDPNDVPDVFKD